MPANPAENGRGRRRTILFAVAAAIVVGLVVGLGTVALLRQHDTGNATQQPTSTSVSPTSSASTLPSTPVSSTSAASSASQSSPIMSTTRTADPVTGKLADGCLGGADAHQAVLAAQTQAPLDNYGAAAFARTFARWTLSYPVDPNAATVIAGISAPGSSFGKTAVADLNSTAQQLATGGYMSASILPNQGQYRIIGGVIGTYKSGQNDGVTVQVQLYRQLSSSSGETAESKLTTTLVLAIANNRWYVNGSLPAGWSVSPDDPSIPWQQYLGAC